MRPAWRRIGRKGSPAHREGRMKNMAAVAITFKQTPCALEV